MSTDNNKDWILCRSYRFPNKFYYFNIHNGESKWARSKKKTLLNSDRSKDNCKTTKINLHTDDEPNVDPYVASMEDKLELNSNKSEKNNDESNTFVTNRKTLPLHSQIHTPTITKENDQKKNIKNKTFPKYHKSFSPLFLSDSEGRYRVNTLIGPKIRQKSFRMSNETGYNRQRKIIWDPITNFHSPDSQSEEDLTNEAVSLLANKMIEVNLFGRSDKMQTGENNFIAQHEQKWFIFRNEQENEELVKFQPFGSNSVRKDVGENIETMKDDICVIVIDLNVLLNDFEFVNNKVLQDTRYRLVIPNAVISKLRNLAEMDHKSDQLMVTAQRLIWKIPTQSRHIILEPEQPISTQQIISCCKKIQNLHYNLILLTSDADLYATALDLNLVCFMMQDVKEGLYTSLFTDSNIHKEKDLNNNLFLQKPENIEPFNFCNATSDANEDYQFFDDFNFVKARLSETVYDKLKKFSLKNYHISSLIVLRAEDYMCTFTQIMETFMSDLLLNESVSCDFCTIPQAVDAVAQLYRDSISIQIVAYRMSALYNLINQRNELENKTKADILIKMVGCGMILVEYIKALKPNSEILLETEYLLVKLLQSIENPHRFENELEQSKIVRKYNSSDTSYEDDDVDYNGNITNHNINEEITKETNFANNRIIRTTGRNLNSLIISNTNGIVLDIDEKYEENNNNDNKINFNKDDEFIKQIFDSTVHENAFTSLENAPKVIRNFDAIKTFEDKLGNKTEKTDTNCDINIEETNTNKYTRIDIDKISEITDISYQTEVYNSESVNEKCTENLTSASNDSGLGKSSCDAYLVLKKFIYEMSSTLNITYEFIKDTSLVLKEKDIKPEERREIFDKAYNTHHRMSQIVDNLTNILKREEGDSVMTLLERTGLDVTNDKIVTQYKQIVTTYLEQIDLLQQALKIIYIATNCNLITPNIEVTK